MKIIPLQKSETHFIWSSKALVGSNLKLLKDVLIEIQKDQILNISQCPRNCVAVNSCIFLDDITLLPGLIDAHVHLALSQPPGVFSTIENNLSEHLRNGIVAVRDGGDTRGLGLALAKRMNSDSGKNPQVIATGQALRKKDKYGSFLGEGIETKDDVREFISKQIKAGAHQIKVLVSGIVSFKEFGKVGPIQFNSQELELIITCAHESGLKVMAHASGTEAVNLALKAGVDSIEHGYFLDNAALSVMAEENIYWVPTVIPVAAQVLKSNLRGSWDSRSLNVINKTYEGQLQKLAEAEEKGVSIGVGTDAGAAGVLHGGSLLEELALYHKAGLTSPSIIKAVTKNNAKILGLEDSLGTIDIKKEPRLIGVQGNPLDNIEALKQIRYVFL